jgi:hypothetical protein
MIGWHISNVDSPTSPPPSLLTTPSSSDDDSIRLLPTWHSHRLPYVHNRYHGLSHPYASWLAGLYFRHTQGCGASFGQRFEVQLNPSTKIALCKLARRQPSSITILSDLFRARAIVETRWVVVLYQLFVRKRGYWRSALREESLTVNLTRFAWRSITHAPCPSSLFHLIRS